MNIANFRHGYFTIVINSLKIKIKKKRMLYAYIFTFSLESCYFEPKGTEFVAADVYWWFYSVTATTVGYGDFSPATLGGRITAFIVMIGGITAMSGVFAKLASTFLNFWNKRKTGMAQLKQTDHVIVIGDGSNRTSKVVSNLLADTTSAEVVLISHLEKNTTDTTLFVHGEITDPIVQKRACYWSSGNNFKENS